MEKYLFLIIFLSSVCFAEDSKPCDLLIDEKAESIYLISEEGGLDPHEYHLFFVCKAVSKPIYFLLLKKAPGMFLDPTEFIGSNDLTLNEHLLRRQVFSEWIVSLSKNDINFISTQFNIFIKKNLEESFPPPDGTISCFEAKGEKQKCFSLYEQPNKNEYNELLKLVHFVDSKFPKGIKSN